MIQVLVTSINSVYLSSGFVFLLFFWVFLFFFQIWLPTVSTGSNETNSQHHPTKFNSTKIRRKFSQPMLSNGKRKPKINNTATAWSNALLWYLLSPSVNPFKMPHKFNTAAEQDVWKGLHDWNLLAAYLGASDNSKIRSKNQNQTCKRRWRPHVGSKRNSHGINYDLNWLWDDD